MESNSTIKRYTALWYNPIAQEEQSIFVKAESREKALELCGILIQCECSKCNANDIESFKEVKENYFYDEDDVIEEMKISNTNIDIDQYELPQEIRDIYLAADDD